MVGTLRTPWPARSSVGQRAALRRGCLPKKHIHTLHTDTSETKFHLKEIYHDNYIEKFCPSHMCFLGRQSLWRAALCPTLERARQGLRRVPTITQAEFKTGGESILFFSHYKGACQLTTILKAWFSCPGQLNSWPSHPVSDSVIIWFCSAQRLQVHKMATSTSTWATMTMKAITKRTVALQRAQSAQETMILTLLPSLVVMS